MMKKGKQLVLIIEDEAIVGLTLDVNGYISGTVSENDGVTATTTFLADVFRILNPAGGAGTEYRNGIWYAYDPASGTRSMWGKPFGGSAKLNWWTGSSSIPEGSETKANASVYISMVAPRFGGNDVPTGGGDVEVTLPNDFGQVRSGSGLSALGSGWQTIASASLTGVVSGQVVTGTISLGGTFGEAIVGNMRMLAGGSLVAGPIPVEIYSDPGSGPQQATVTGVAIGGGTQTFQIQIENGSFGGSAIGDWSIARIASASPTNPGFMSAQQAEQLASLVAGGGGGSGAPLATTAPPAIGAASAVGTGTAAARNDHNHAHGNQAGGSLHAVATTSADGFLSASDKTKLNGIAAGATANSPEDTSAGANTLVKRGPGGNIATNTVINFTGGSSNSLTASGTNLTANANFFAFTVTEVSDVNEKENIRYGDPADCLAIVSNLKPAWFDFRRDGRSSFGFLAQQIVDYAPEAVTRAPNDGPLGINYGMLAAPMAGAIQALLSRIETLETEVAQLRAA